VAKVKTPIKAIRQYCIDCSETAKMVAWCPCNGVNSTWCPLWPFRFGLRPETAARKYGRHVITPEMMPDADVNLENLPANPALWKSAAQKSPAPLSSQA